MRRLGWLALSALVACTDQASGPPSTPVEAVATGPAYAIVGEPVVLDGSATTGAVRFQWSFGDGQGWSEPRADSKATATYAQPGRYQAVLTATNAAGAKRTAAVNIVVTHPLVHTPRQSSTITALADGARFAAVSEDSGEVTVVARGSDDSFAVERRLDTCAHPRTVTAWTGWIAVSCPDDDRVELLPLGGGERKSISLPHGSRPHGVVASNGSLFVTLQGTGRLVEYMITGPSPVLMRDVKAIDDARGVAVLPDRRVAVTRWRSPDERGEVALLSLGEGTNEVRPLAYDPQTASDTEVGGVPSYLGQFLVAPDGKWAAVPSLQANYNEAAPNHETFIRAIFTPIDLEKGEEVFAKRRQFDNRGFASAGAFSSRGDYLFLAMRGNRSIERYDTLNWVQAGSIFDAGHAPEGLVLTADDRYLLVHAPLSREVVVFDVSDFRTIPRAKHRLPLQSREALDEEVLRGKQLFNDSSDPRLGQDGYMACAHCHLEGDSDRRVWNFTARGEGLRNTISLLGRGGTAHGPIHWSANFDEVQDFENDIRHGFQGKGLMTDEQFRASEATLGEPKKGVSADLDALAAYVASLKQFRKSPHRTETGELTEVAERGRAIFTSPATGCTTCHAGERLTDSQWLSPGVPLLHDVGTLREGSGQRLGEALTGLDTPTLHGLWDSAPYLHDGSAATLREVLTTRNVGDSHGVTSHLSEAELAELEAYLLSLDGRVE